MTSPSAFDTGWIAVLLHVPPAGEPFPITAGWLRASLSRVIEEKSESGAPVLDHRRPIAVPVGQRVLYRMPIVAKARRMVCGHRLRPILASEDADERNLALFGFTHTVVRDASVNTVYSASRLLLPMLRS